ncbi:hypothetical protein [Celeribacter ethanolicus]|nr:hypothetical protein [Celeribacter ethanolicus]
MGSIVRPFCNAFHSVAVREGVKKTLEVTKTHFDKPPYHFTVYDSARKSQVSGFALSDGIEIMVMTIDAFKRAETVIRQSREGLDPPIYQLQETRPVLILDEPQNMESDLSVSALASLNPICALRYSATHRNTYNVVYRLTPFDAYRQGLVKRIEVASVVQQDNENLPFVRVEELNATKRTVSAKLSVHKLMATGRRSKKNPSRFEVAIVWSRRRGGPNTKVLSLTRSTPDRVSSVSPTIRNWPLVANKAPTVMRSSRPKLPSPPKSTSAANAA